MNILKWNRLAKKAQDEYDRQVHTAIYGKGGDGCPLCRKTEQ
jgi:hypothetical protein